MGGPARVHIVGIGDDGLEGLTRAARDLIDQADCVIGTESTLADLAVKADTACVGSDLNQLIDQLARRHQQRVVLLASGDPLFYGVARYLCDQMGKDRFEVIPHVSSMQLAFARVKESWDDAYLANLATQPLARVVERVRTAEKVGLFTTDRDSPSVVARALMDHQIDYFTAYVCENLGSPDERVTHGELADLVDQEFSPLNVLILVRKPNVPDRPVEMLGKRLFGNADEQFVESQPKRGLLTPMEVRVIALAELDLGPRSTVWDVGAGSGSVAVEAARLAPEGHVYAIEMDPEDHQLIRANAERFGVTGNLIPVLGRAPEAWDPLPDPDAVFVGGTGRAVGRITQLALARLRPGGRLVVNMNSLDNVTAVCAAAAEAKIDVRVSMIQIAHAADQLERLRLEAMNPTFLIRALKPLSTSSRS